LLLLLLLLPLLLLPLLLPLLLLLKLLVLSPAPKKTWLCFLSSGEASADGAREPMRERVMDSLLACAKFAEVQDWLRMASWRYLCRQ